jgi:hypothetical protein
MAKSPQTTEISVCPEEVQIQVRMPATTVTAKSVVPFFQY